MKRPEPETEDMHGNELSERRRRVADEEHLERMEEWADWAEVEIKKLSALAYPASFETTEMPKHIKAALGLCASSCPTEVAYIRAYIEALGKIPNNPAKGDPGWLTRAQIIGHRDRLEAEPTTFIWRLCDMALRFLNVWEKADKIGELEEANTDLLCLVTELTDRDECSYDHHGYCQTHSLHEKPCPHARAKQFLATSGEDRNLDTSLYCAAKFNSPPLAGADTQKEKP